MFRPSRLTNYLFVLVKWAYSDIAWWEDWLHTCVISASLSHAHEEMLWGVKITRSFCILLWSSERAVTEYQSHPGFDWNFKCVTYSRHDELQHLLVHRQKHWGRYNDACRELGCWEWSWEDANKHSRDALERARVEIERWRFALQKLLIRSNRYLKTKRPVMCCLIEPAHRSIPHSQRRKCVVALLQAPLRTRKYKNSIRFAKRPSFFLKDAICSFSNESRTLYTTSVVKIS